MSTLLPLVEHAMKKPVWDCRMCGQCVLHSTGMTCPMTCPKQLRNGPCGGVGEDGSCEVNPEMRCVWLKAQGRAEWLPKRWREEVAELRPPVDNQLWGTSSWTNLMTGRDKVTPVSWQESTEDGEDMDDAAKDNCTAHEDCAPGNFPAVVQTTVVGTEAEVAA